MGAWAEQVVSKVGAKYGTTPAGLRTLFRHCTPEGSSVGSLQSLTDALRAIGAKVTTVDVQELIQEASVAADVAPMSHRLGFAEPVCSVSLATCRPTLGQGASL